MRLGVYVSVHGAMSMDTILQRFREAEQAGFHTAWTGQLFDHDALTLLALAGRCTDRIELGSWVLPIQTRHPLFLAQQALTTQCACDGRLLLGIGVGHAAVIEKRLGLSFDAPATQMRETLEVLRPLVAGEAVDHAGAVHRVSARLSIAETATLPLFVAALGPAMLRVAAELGDGLCLWLAGPRYLEDFALPRLRQAERADFRIVCGLPVLLINDLEAGRRAATAFLAQSARLPSYRRVLERGGVAQAVDVAIVGDEGEIRTSLSRLADLGVTDFHAVPVPVADDPKAVKRTTQLLAELARASRRPDEPTGGPICPPNA